MKIFRILSYLSIILILQTFSLDAAASSCHFLKLDAEGYERSGAVFVAKVKDIIIDGTPDYPDKRLKVRKLYTITLDIQKSWKGVFAGQTVTVEAIDDQFNTWTDIPLKAGNDDYLLMIPAPEGKSPVLISQCHYIRRLSNKYNEIDTIDYIIKNIEEEKEI